MSKNKNNARIVAFVSLEQQTAFMQAFQGLHGFKSIILRCLIDSATEIMKKSPGAAAAAALEGRLRVVIVDEKGEQT